MWVWMGRDKDNVFFSRLFVKTYKCTSESLKTILKAINHHRHSVSAFNLPMCLPLVNVE